MTPPNLDLSTTTRRFPSTESSTASSPTTSRRKVSSSPVSPTLRAYSDRVRTARRPSWTPEIYNERSKPSLQARPSGLVHSTSEAPSSTYEFPSPSPSPASNSLLFVQLSKPELEDLSPSYPFPRMNRRNRPQPLSAFSTDSTLRSRTSESGDSCWSESMMENESSRSIVIEDTRRTSARLASSSKSSSSSSLCVSMDHEDQPKIYLRGSNGSTSLEEMVISPLTLGTLQEPLSPLSPFGNIALFDALSPLPTPKFDAGCFEEIDVSALTMERFERDEGFPWTSSEDTPRRRSSGGRVIGEEVSWAREASTWARGQGNLDTPPSSNPSPSSSRPNPLLLPGESILLSPTASFSRTHKPPRPVRPGSSSVSFSNPFSPSTLLTSFPIPPSPSTTTNPTNNRLRRSTINLASIFCPKPSLKPCLERGRSASLPTTPTRPSDNRNPLRSFKRSISLSRKRTTREKEKRTILTTNVSQVRKSSISPPVPVPPPSLSITSGRRAFEVPRSPPTMAQFRVPSSSSTDSDEIVDPFFSSPPNSNSTSFATETSISSCSSCLGTEERLKREQDKSKALESEVERLRKVVQVLLQ
ncbi:hypothetical protein JCM16303_001565 [Sporobolomyces ruberrimus]